MEGFFFVFFFFVFCFARLNTIWGKQSLASAFGIQKENWG